MVCRQLSLPSENTLVARTSAGYCQSWLENVDSRGTEENIWSCGHMYSGALKLGMCLKYCGCSLSSYSISQRKWDIDDAKVVYRQLALSYENALVKTWAYFGKGTGPIRLDNVNCTGSEQNVAVCKQSGW